MPDAAKDRADPNRVPDDAHEITAERGPFGGDGREIIVKAHQNGLLVVIQRKFLHEWPRIFGKHHGIDLPVFCPVPISKDKDVARSDQPVKGFRERPH